MNKYAGICVIINQQQHLQFVTTTVTLRYTTKLHDIVYPAPIDDIDASDGTGDESDDMESSPGDDTKSDFVFDLEKLPGLDKKHG
jgi:hypothetical protein